MARRALVSVATALSSIGIGTLAVVSSLPARAAEAPASVADPVAEASRASLDVVLLIDSSDAVRGAPLNTAQDVATAYINSMPPEVRVGVVTYGQFPTSMYPLSTNRTGPVAAIGAVTSEGDAAIFDGLEFASSQFSIGSSSRRQIVLIGPGNELGSDLSAEAGIAAARRLSIRVDAIVVDAPGTTSDAADLAAGQTGGSRTLWSDKNGLAALAARTLTWARPAPEVVAAAIAATAPPPKKSLFANPFVLLGGGVLVFAGLAYSLLTLTAQRVKRVDLVGLSVTEVEKKSGSSPMGGIADRLTKVTEKALEKQSRARGLGVSLERAGINLKPSEFVIVAAGVLFGIFAVLWWLKGPLIAAGITAVLVLIGPRKWVARKAAKRSMAFGEQLSDTLQLLSSSLRAGQGLMQAIDSVAKEGDPPAADEFRRVVTEVRLGRDLIDSLRAMADRVQSEDFNWVIPAIEINREVGGDLAEVLDTVASTIRDRADIRRQVKTLSAEGRLSAYVLLSLPVGIAGFIQMSNPDYLAELQSSPGYYLAGAAVLMMIIGGVWLFKLCKIEF